MAVVQMHLSMLEATDANRLTTVSTLLSDAVADVRDISHNLYPIDLEKGLVKALESLFEQLNLNNRNIHFALEIDTAFKTPINEEELDFILYRVAQELINNTLKYSKATTVTLKLTDTKQGLLLEVTDNGIGFDTTLEHCKGIGLKTMMERVRHINGHLTIESTPGVGTRCSLNILF
jgi:signal transduction histidine kinase